MNRASSFQGRMVIALDSGAVAGRVERLICDVEGGRLGGLIVRGQAAEGEAWAVPADEVQSIGEDAILIQRDPRLVPPETRQHLVDMVRKENRIYRSGLYNTKGKKVGYLVEPYFEPGDGMRLAAFELFSDVLFQDRVRGVLLYGPHMAVGKDLVLVQDDLAAHLQNPDEGLPELSATLSAPPAGRPAPPPAEVLLAPEPRAPPQPAALAGGHSDADLADLDSVVVQTYSQPRSAMDPEPVPPRAATASPAPPHRAPPPLAPPPAFPPPPRSAPPATPAPPEPSAAEHEADASTALVPARLALALGAPEPVPPAKSEAAAGGDATGDERLVRFVLGKPSGRDVRAPDGTMIATRGTVIDREAVEKARAYDMLTQLFLAASQTGGRV